jgi:hypothetical protein
VLSSESESITRLAGDFDAAGVIGAGLSEPS